MIQSLHSNAMCAIRDVVMWQRRLKNCGAPRVTRLARLIIVSVMGLLALIISSGEGLSLNGVLDVKMEGDSLELDGRDLCTEEDAWGAGGCGVFDGAVDPKDARYRSGAPEEA